MRLLPLCASLGILSFCAPLPTAEAQGSVGQAPAQASTDDPHLWLEEVEGDRALAWVRERNTRSLAVLQGDPRYQRMYDGALRILEARDRIAAPSFRGRTIYN